MEQENGQIVIYGREGHAEVIGLKGQTNNQAIVIEKPEDYNKIDPGKPTTVFAQTTKSIDKFQKLGENIQNYSNSEKIKIHDTICRQVSNRVPRMKEFSAQHDVIIFVGGQKSSNARFLFEVCEQTNPNSYFISFPEDLKKEWFSKADSVGICGATSTPQWLMEQIAKIIKDY